MTTAAARRAAAWSAVALALACCLTLAEQKQEQQPRTGPATEKRFPPLKVPDGFTATLFACDPLVEYPSVIAAGPRPGTLFVAADFMTGLGTEIVRRDEVRLIEDTDDDGYADKATVYADKFNSIQGMLYHAGALYVMHAPYLTVLRGTDKDGKATERRDLLTGLGLPPEEDQIRLHNANGLVAGHDGWLYLALGDRGCDVKRPEGDRLVLHGGGVLRCRPDGRDLHVFSTGSRNVYDLALDEEQTVFFRDNENDGGKYKIRVCHSFFGADHGYPYLYDERPDEALAPLADLGLGSSAGAVCYLENQFPAEYRGKLFFCEWGRSVTTYPLKRSGSSFATAKETDFAAGAGNDPYGFKPTDLVVDYDGSLFVSDWADGQRPKRGRGRIYRIRHAGKGEEKLAVWPKRPQPYPNGGSMINSLDSESYDLRRRAQAWLARRGTGKTLEDAMYKMKRVGPVGRLHAVWLIAGGQDAVERLLAVCKRDTDPRVQAQAVRAIADLTDPVLVGHKLDAKPGDEKLAERLAKWGAGKEARILLEVVIALGRLRWAGAPAWLHENLKQPDAALAHAAAWALRQSADHKSFAALLDRPSSDHFRPIALRAVAGQYAPRLVDALISRLKNDDDAGRQREYADALTRVYKRPSSPWTYWGFRPPPRPANTVSWERTEAIEKALNEHLESSKDRAGRLQILRQLSREKVPVKGKTLAAMLKSEADAATMTALLEATRGRPGAETRAALEGVLRDTKQTTSNRLLAASLFVEGLDADEEGGKRLLGVAEAVEDGPTLAALLRALGARTMAGGSKLLLGKLASGDAEVRACAVEALAALGPKEAHDPIRKLLADKEPRVRAAAALASGKLSLRPAIERLLILARDPDAGVRRASLEALRLLREPKALPVAVAALGDAETAAQALECVAELGGPANAGAVADLARRAPSNDVLSGAGKTLAGWAARDGSGPADRAAIDRAFAEIHGDSGVLLGWHVRGPLMMSSDADALAKRLTVGEALPTAEKPEPGWRRVLSSGIDARVRLAPAKDAGTWLAYVEMTLASEAKVDFFTTGSSAATVWLGDKVVHRRDRPAVPGPYPERFSATLAKGRNRILVRLDGVKPAAGEFSLRFRRVAATAHHERLALASLSRAGNPENGRKVFLNVEKSLCLKCHRADGVEGGERIGPDLTGLGSRFSKAYVIESILEPSRTVSPSFASSRVVLKNGRTLDGIKVTETDAAVTLADNEGKKHEIARDRIDRLEALAGSAMPEGLEKRLSEDEFVDLVSFLVNLRKK